MKNFKIFLTALTLFFGVTQTANAIYVEPFLGYAVSGEAGSNNDDYSGGPLLGARLGAGLMGFFIAGEYEIGSGLTIDSNPSRDVDTTNLGISVGYEFPILVRVYGTYFIKSELEFSGAEYEGTGTKIGVGYTGLPFVAINFELNEFTYDKLNGNDISSNFDASYYAINISIPL